MPALNPMLALCLHCSESISQGWGWAPRHPDRWIWQPGDYVCASSVGETEESLCQGDLNSFLFWLYLLQGEGCRLTLHEVYASAEIGEGESRASRKIHPNSYKSKTFTEKKWGGVTELHTPLAPLGKTKHNSSWQVHSSEHAGKGAETCCTGFLPVPEAHNVW